jgi:acyl carrier protein
MGVEMQEHASRDQLKALMGAVISVHGHTVPEDESTDLRDIPFRSLDFSELALRVEDEIGRELNFDAPGLRSIRTVSDVLDLLEQLQAA